MLCVLYCIKMSHGYFNICTYTNLTVGIYKLCLHISRGCIYVIIIYLLIGDIYGNITLDIGTYMSYITFLYGNDY